MTVAALPAPASLLSERCLTISHASGALTYLARRFQAGLAGDRLLKHPFLGGGGERETCHTDHCLELTGWAGVEVGARPE